MKRNLRIALMAVPFALAGCLYPYIPVADAGPDQDVVEGKTVTLKGKPLEMVRVEFIPVKDGPQSAAITDSQGHFALVALDGETKGAVVGTHKVVLRDFSVVEDRFYGRAGADLDLTSGKKPRTSNKYTNVTLTPLQVDISDEKRDLVLEVEPYSDKG